MNNLNIILHKLFHLTQIVKNTYHSPTQELTLMFHSELFIHLEHWLTTSHNRIFYPQDEHYIFKTFLKATISAFSY